MLPAGGRQHRRCIIPQAVTQSNAPEDGRNYGPKHGELIGIINKPLLFHLVGCLYYCLSDAGHTSNLQGHEFSNWAGTRIAPLKIRGCFKYSKSVSQAWRASSLDGRSCKLFGAKQSETTEKHLVSIWGTERAVRERLSSSVHSSKADSERRRNAQLNLQKMGTLGFELNFLYKSWLYASRCVGE